MKNIMILCGGVSSEHEISLRSAQSILNYSNRDKYRVYATYITKKGVFISLGEITEKVESPESLMRESDLSVRASISAFLDEIADMEDLFIIPVIHGTTGEDGQIQGFLETLQIPYVGNGIASSAICMDKGFANQIFEANGIPQARYAIVKRSEYEKHKEDGSFVDKIMMACGEKVFVKPANNGSSVGVSRATADNLMEAIAFALQYDDKAVVEEEIVGEELEISVIGNDNPKASLPGSYSTTRDFFDYTAKYNDRTLVRNTPHELEESACKKVRELAIAAYQATGCRGFARVDIFMDKDQNFYVNEINTFPGMTFSSLSADLWKVTDGTTFGEIIDQLIDLAVDDMEKEKRIKKTRDE